MDCRKDGCKLFVRLHKGENFFEALESALTKMEVQTAAVLTGIGMLEKCELGYFKGACDYAKELLEEPHELVSLQGIALKEEKGYNFHFHAGLANDAHNMRGGHLFSAIVAVTAELVLIKADVELKRELEAKSGLMGLKLQ